MQSIVPIFYGMKYCIQGGRWTLQITHMVWQRLKKVFAVQNPEQAWISVTMPYPGSQMCVLTASGKVRPRTVYCQCQALLTGIRLQKPRCNGAGEAEKQLGRQKGNQGVQPRRWSKGYLMLWMDTCTQAVVLSLRQYEKGNSYNINASLKDKENRWGIVSS